MGRTRATRHQAGSKASLYTVDPALQKIERTLSVLSPGHGSKGRKGDRVREWKKKVEDKDKVEEGGTLPSWDIYGKGQNECGRAQLPNRFSVHLKLSLKTNAGKYSVY